jgi:hypothetical protein
MEDMCADWREMDDEHNRPIEYCRKYNMRCVCSGSISQCNLNGDIPDKEEDYV